jgi:quinol monooxygenase YgiN
MIAIAAKITLDPQSADTYIEAARQIIPLSRAEAGCNHYAFGRDVDHHNIIWITEEWTSEQALLDHLASPHIVAFLARTASMKLLAVDVKKYDVRSVGGL